MLMSDKSSAVCSSDHPYTEETLQSVPTAVDSGCKVLAISDSLVSPVAKPATLVLQVREAEIRKFRSLSASMCLAQALVISYAFVAIQKPPSRAAPQPAANHARKRNVYCFECKNRKYFTFISVEGRLRYETGS